MGHIFSTAANAVLPIMLLILLGFILKKKGFLSEDFLKTGNKLIFNVCLPVMLFVNVYNIESVNALRWDLILYCIALVFIIFAMGFATALMTTKVIARRGVLLQCTFRSNFAIIGLSLAAAVGGSGAESMAAVVSAFVIPVFNVLGVVALSIFDENKKRHDFAGILQSVVKNPLIIGAVTGLLCLLIRYAQECVFGEVVFSVRRELPFVLSAMNQLKNCTTPLALIILGGQFQFSAAKEAMSEIVVGTLWRIVIAPVLGIGAAICLSRYTNWISFGPDEFPRWWRCSDLRQPYPVPSWPGKWAVTDSWPHSMLSGRALGQFLTLFLTVCALMSMELLAV